MSVQVIIPLSDYNELKRKAELLKEDKVCSVVDSYFVMVDTHYSIRIYNKDETIEMLMKELEHSKAKASEIYDKCYKLEQQLKPKIKKWWQIF